MIFSAFCTYETYPHSGLDKKGKYEAKNV